MERTDEPICHLDTCPTARIGSRKSLPRYPRNGRDRGRLHVPKSIEPEIHDIVKRLLMLYATREGHTRRVADHVAASLRARGFAVDVMSVGDELAQELDLGRYAGAVLAASVHVGKHERAMAEFVKTHRADLERLPTTFLSVSLSEAGAEDPNASAERRNRAAANVKTTIGAFLRDTGWSPGHIHPVAGALLYQQYRPVVRFVMRFISKVSGGSTDTSRDHEYTDWQALTRFADELAASVDSQTSADVRGET